MKRPAPADDVAKKRAKMKHKVADDGGGGGGGGEVVVEEKGCGFPLDDDLLFEVLRHVDDARTLAAAACVGRQWHRTAKDERLWELVCIRNWRGHPVGCGTQQLRSVVLALGGFRRLHAHCLLPLIKPPPLLTATTSASGSSSSSPPQPPPSLPPAISAQPPANWGKDEVHLSLSLLSIRYYEKMNINKFSR